MAAKALVAPATLVFPKLINKPKNRSGNSQSSYKAPRMYAIGRTTEMLQGGGGMSGSDVLHYWYRLS